jgi:hypothetical protein
MQILAGKDGDKGSPSASRGALSRLLRQYGGIVCGADRRHYRHG